MKPAQPDQHIDGRDGLVLLKRGLGCARHALLEPLAVICRHRPGPYCRPARRTGGRHPLVSSEKDLSS